MSGTNEPEPRNLENPKSNSEHVVCHYGPEQEAQQLWEHGVLVKRWTQMRQVLLLRLHRHPRLYAMCRYVRGQLPNDVNNLDLLVIKDLGSVSPQICFSNYTKEGQRFEGSSSKDLTHFLARKRDKEFSIC